MLCLMYMTFYTLKDAYLLSKEPLQQQNSRKNWSKSASHMRIVNTNQSLRSCLFCFHNEYNSWSYFDCVNLMIKLKVCFCAGLVNFSLLTHIKVDKKLHQNIYWQYIIALQESTKIWRRKSSKRFHASLYQFSSSWWSLEHL